MSSHHSVECSECGADITLDLEEGIATARVGSNGLRGAKHVPAHYVTAPVFVSGVFAMWECPVCGYADSFDPASEA